VWVGIARGCGADLNILMMLIPLSMMKSTHTRLREVQCVLKYFPIDEMIEIHINLSKLAVGFTVGHVIQSFCIEIFVADLVTCLSDAVVPDFGPHHQCFRL
jgi:hypothetical protein